MPAATTSEGIPSSRAAPPDHLTTARVGMIGAGQLARMTQRAAIDLGVHLEVLALGPDDPAVLAGAGSQVGRPDDLSTLRALAASVDVLTLDHELVPSEHLEALVAEGHVVRPAPGPLRCAQDKLHARTELARRSFPVPAFAAVTDASDVASFAQQHGWPVVLKAIRGGYDGRGVEVVADRSAAAAVLGRGGEWMVEALVPIAAEVAVVTARRPGGQAVTYPVVETVQRDGICVELVLPARLPDEVRSSAMSLAERVVTAIDAVGIVALELFVTTDGGLVVNELALRPHNSGHVTIEGATVSQFHNHLRAVLDWPLGDTSLRAPVAVTVNLLGGDEPTDLAARLPDALAVPGAHVHLYGKTSRPGRKIGHVTVLGDPADGEAAAEVALERARTAAARLVGPGARPSVPEDEHE